MSKEYWTLKEEAGETAFLAGIVDILSDTLSLICDSGFDFDADIFCIPKNDFTALDDGIKRRLKVYNESLVNNSVKQKDINFIHFELERVDENVMEYVCKSFQNYSSCIDLQKAINEFFDGLNWYLQKPICIYKPSNQCPKQMLDILGHIYLYMAFEYFFIAYNEYIVLFVFGTSE